MMSDPVGLQDRLSMNLISMTWCRAIICCGGSTDNALVESFNGQVRAECIDQNGFLTPDDARSKCVAYRRGYNEERPYSAIGNKTLMAYMKTLGPSSGPHGLKSGKFRREPVKSPGQSDCVSG